ncbi:MAG: SpoIIIAH-like family protein [Clostridia bacterium]|nr:SpoIIIAH-like family protein [Clostridia bacterium]
MKKFLTGIRGKQILVAGLAVLVAVAGYYRWAIEKDGTTVAVMNETKNQDGLEQPLSTEKQQENMTDYFAKARYERDCARSEAAELLKVSNTDGENAEELAEKNLEMLEVFARNMEKETAIENMVIAKGYQDCVAFVDDAGVRVVVKSDTLQAEGVAQIKDIVVDQTGAKATDIRISTKE